MTQTEKTEKTEKKSKQDDIITAPAAAAESVKTAGPIFGHAVDIAALLSYTQPKMAISRIIMPDFDSRAGEEELPQDFIDSLQDGLWQPIILVPILGSDKFMVVGGRRRLRGYIKLGRKEIAFTVPEGLVMQNAKDQAGFQLALQKITVSENKFRKDLNHWDTAVTFLKQKQAGVPQESIASMWGVKAPYVSQHLALFTKLQPASQELCRKHANDPGMFSKARKLCEIDEPEVQVQIAKDAFDPKNNFDVAAVDQLVERYKVNKASLLEKEEARKKAAAEAAANKGKGDDKKAEGGKAEGGKAEGKKEEEEKKSPFAEAKPISVGIGRKLLEDHAARVKKLVSAPNTDKEKLAFEKGVQKGLEMAFGVTKLPAVYNNDK